MRDPAFDSLAELLTVAVELLAAVALTIVGVGAEVAGLSRLGASVDLLAVWYLLMGCLALYVGIYVLGVRTLLSRLSA